MPGGLQVGAAFFTLYGDNAQLLAALNQARVMTETATKAMANAQKAWAQAAITTNAQQKAALEQTARAYEATAARVSANLQGQMKLLKQLGYEFNATGKAAEGLGISLGKIGSTLATLTGFGAIASGALVVREAFLALHNATQQLNQAQFSLNALYGQAAPVMQQYAAELAKTSGRSLADATQAANAFSSVQRNYAVTFTQVQELMTIAADAAAVRGVTLEQAALRIEGALRGEAESIEYLGFSLNSNYLKALQNVDSAERKYFETLGPAQKAQIIMNELRKQGSQFTGEAAKRTEEAAGATDLMAAAFSDLGAAIGQVANPQLTAFAHIVHDTVEALIPAIKEVADLESIGEQFATQKGVPEWMATLMSPAFKAALGLIGLVGDPSIRAGRAAEEERKRAEEKAKADAAVRQKDLEARAKQEKDAAETRARQLAEIEKKARERAVDAENAAYDARKARAQVEKDEATKNAEAKRDAALDAIRVEKDAAEEAHEATMARLQKEKQALEQAAEDRHTAAARTLEAEKDAVELANEYQLRGLKQQLEDQLRASEERRDILLRELELEERDREDARTREDRALQDQTERLKRELDDRHQANLDAIADEERSIRARGESRSGGVEDRGRQAKARADARKRALDDEKHAADLAHKAALDALEREQQAADDRHDAIIDQIEAEQRAAQDRHDEIARGIEEETRAAKDHHDQVARAIEEEERAARDRHDLLTRALEEEADAARLVHDQRMDQLDAEADAAKARYELAARALEVELDTAKAVHEATVRGLKERVRLAKQAHDLTIRGLEQEADAAERAHDAEVDRLDALKDAEDDRHKAAMQNIEDEANAKLAYVDATLAALDEEERRESGANKLADLQTALQKALSTGNLGEIQAAERDLLEEQNKQSRDAQRSQLEARKDALKAGLDAAKDAASAEHDLIERGLAQARDAADARLQLIKDEVAARKQAADDQLDQIEAIADEQERAADDELDRIEASVRARKQAAEDERDQALQTIEARKRQFDAEFEQIMASIEHRKQAADDDLDLILRNLDQRKRAADDDLDLILRNLDQRKRANDDELDLIARNLDARKRAADDELEAAKRVLAGKKDALDQEKAKRDEVFRDAEQKAQLEEQRESEKVRKAKERIDEQTRKALDALRERKEAEDRRHTEAERQADDELTEAKRRIADRRLAENRASEDRKTEIQTQYQHEQDTIRDTAEAAIQASRDALAAYQRDWGTRKQVLDDNYQHERDQIKATYDDPETGLIPKQKKAYDETKKWYDERTREVNTQYDHEKQKIYETFDHPETGLFAKLEAVHKETVDKLKGTEEDWQKGFADPIKRVTEQTFAAINSELDRLVGRLEQGAKVGFEGPEGDEPSGDPGRRRGGGGMGGRVAGGGYRPVVEDATGNSYWTAGGTHGGSPAADIFAPKGSAIRAPVSGYSYPARYSLGGNTTTLRGDDGRWYYFAHGNEAFKGGDVRAGDLIGRVGTTGNAEGTSPHLHFAIASARDVFGDRNGSGDIWGDESYWQGGGGNAPPGAGQNPEDAEYLVISLFGKVIKIRLPRLFAQGSALVQAIQQMATEIGGREFGRVAAAVADSEGAGGDLSQAGAGGARGPFQFDPGGELRNYARYLHTSLEEAGEYAARFPLKAARYALTGGDADAGFSGEGYLGRAIRAGQDRAGLAGAELAEYASRYGQRPYGDYWKRAGDSYRRLFGYARGGPIPEPTLLVGKTMGPYAMAGEHATEWVTPTPAGGNGRAQHIEMPIYVGGREVERFWLDGFRMNVKRGRNFSSIIGKVP